MPREYHDGELAVQARAGTLAQASKLARTVRSSVPDALSRFLPTLQWVMIGAPAADGCVWASPLFGPAGFVYAERDVTVKLRARLHPADPLHDMVLDSQPHGAGLLAIDMNRRMRARINGRLQADREGMTLYVDECYANCPKYIQRRTLIVERRPGDVAHLQSDRLSDALLTLVRHADTMFVATVGPDRSADVSHRGGSPGFLECSGDGRVIRFVDEPGNGVFNTLGNLHVDDRAGLTVIGFETGEVLQMTGHAKLVTPSSDFSGQRRTVEFTVDRCVHTINVPFTSTRVNDAV